MKKRPHFAREQQRFRAAVHGLVLCICAESHLRFHMVAALTVLLASFFFELTALHYAVLLLTFALVIAAELFNTAVERLTDDQSSAFSARAGAIKDISAGAVLVCALLAVGIGACIFLPQPEGFARLIAFFAVSGLRTCGGVLLAALLVLYVSPGPAVLIRAARRKFKNSHRSERKPRS